MKELVKKVFEKFGYKRISEKNSTLSPDPYNDQKRLIRNEDKIVIFDVGAHHGQTMIKYNQLFDKCTIYSFEPFADSYNVLIENAKGWTNTEIFNIALGNSVGDVNFHVNKFPQTNSLLPTHKEGSSTWGENLLDTIEILKVKQTTIDEFVKTKSIERIDILKIDTQGTEYQVIEGAANAIAQGKVKLIYLEIIVMPTYENQKHLDEILNLLRNQGFDLYNIYNSSFTKNGSLRQFDAIFLSKK